MLTINDDTELWLFLSFNSSRSFSNTFHQTNIKFWKNLPHMYHQQQNTLYHQRWQILRRELFALSWFILCWPRLLPIKDLPSIVGCEPIRSFKKLFSQNMAPLGVKGILLPLLHFLHALTSYQTGIPVSQIRASG